MRRDLVQVSKFLSLVLRHDPGQLGVELDAQGWVPIQELLTAMRAAGSPVEEALHHEVVRTNEKQRFVLSEDGLRIRASQRHSLDVDLELEAREPPDVLFHGTAEHFVASILAAGLKPGSRQFVHLALDVPSACLVGARHGKPVVLRVEAGAAHAAGHPFFCSANGVWLTAFVAPEFVVIGKQA